MSSNGIDVVVVGCGGMGRETVDLLAAATSEGARWNVIGILNDAAAGDPATAVAGLPVLGGCEWISGRPMAVVVSIGAPADRAAVVRRLRSFGCRSFPAAVHPAATIGQRVEIGDGSVVLAGAVLTTDITLGRFSIVNVGATVSHDVVAEQFTTLGPGVHLAGSVIVGEGADLGTAAATVQEVTIGAWSVVGAGAVVTADVPENAVAVGVPARVIKLRPKGWHEPNMGRPRS